MFCLEHTCLSQYKHACLSQCPCSHRTCMFITVSLWPQRGLFSHCWCFEDDISGMERKLLAYKRLHTAESSAGEEFAFINLFGRIIIYSQKYCSLWILFWLYVCVCVQYVQVSVMPIEVRREEGTGSPAARVTATWCGCWGPNFGGLEKQQGS